ncbi:MAG: hypothetical protein ACXWWL_03890 [Candidatus Limnocylindria bacterium]
MAWIDDALPLPAARPLEGEEALEAALHALAALAAGIAALQAFMAFVVGASLPAAFYTAALLATGACAFVSDRSRVRRAAFLAGGSASVLVWLAVLPQAQGQTMVVVLAMAGASAFITRRMLFGDGERQPSAVQPYAAPSGTMGWIEDDREGTLAGT